LIAETIELVEDAHFATSFGAVRNIEDLLDAEGTGRADESPDVVLFADVVDE
jgi:hypothetical protein